MSCWRLSGTQCLFWTAARHRQSSTGDTCTGSPPSPGVPVRWDGKSPAKVSPSSLSQLLSLPCISPGDGAQAYETISPAWETHSLRAGGSLAKALVNTNLNYIVSKVESTNSGIIWSHLPSQARSSRAHCTELWSDSPGISQVGETRQPGQSVPVRDHLHREVLPHVQLELI